MAKLLYTTTVPIKGTVEYLAGQRLTTIGEVADYFRAVTLESDGVKLALTDERAAELVAANYSKENEGDGDHEVVIIEALIDANKSMLQGADYAEENTDTITADMSRGLLDSAETVAGKLSEATIEDMESLIVKATEVENTARTLCIDMVRDLKEEGMLALPVPDSKPGDTNNPDRWSFYAPDPETGKRRKYRGSFYNAFELALPAGKAGALAIKGLKAAGLAANAKRSLDAPAEYIKMPLAERKAEYRRLDQAQQRRRKMVRNAVKLWWQMRTIASIPGLTCEFMYITRDDKRMLTPSSGCIRVRHKDDPDKVEVYSVAQLLTLKPGWVNELTIKTEGGAFEALVVSGSREMESNRKEAAKITSAEAAVKVMGALMLYANDDTNRGILLKRLSDKKSAAERANFMALWDDLAAVAEIIRPIWAKEEQARDAAAKKIADAHNAKLKQG